MDPIPIKDRGGRRLIKERREFSYAKYIPERRNGKNRRSGIERRTGENRRKYADRIREAHLHRILFGG